MSESQVSQAARILRIGDEFSATNAKLIEAVHSFLSWFCPLMRHEQLPLRGWEIGWWGGVPEGVCGIIIKSHADDDVRFQIRSDGFECDILDYVYFATQLEKNAETLRAWMDGNVKNRLRMMQSVNNLRPPA